MSEHVHWGIDDLAAAMVAADDGRRTGRRAWTEQDAAPTDWPTVVDEDGVTWRPTDEDGMGVLTYRQQRIAHLATGGATSGLMVPEFRDIFDSIPEGSVLREASPEEALTWVETWESVGGAQ